MRNNFYKNLILALGLLFTAGNSFAQDDLMKALEAGDNDINYIKHTFKTTRVLQGQSVENMSAGDLDFRINHRFGKVNDGAYGFYGLDGAQTRLSLEYGITNDIMVGVGRSTINKTYDGFAKFKLLKQSTGAVNMPISVSLFTSAALTAVHNNLVSGVPDSVSVPLGDRMSYCTQLLIARKFGERLSLQITPGWIHYNLTAEKHYANDQFHIGIGGRVKLTKRTSFNAEYFAQMSLYGQHYLYYQGLGNKNCFSVGFDIETGGHVFQLHLTNAIGSVEQIFINQTTDSWKNGGIHFGFNISRTFGLINRK